MLTNSEVTDLIIDCKIRVKHKDMDVLRELAKRPEIKLTWVAAKGSGVSMFGGSVSEWNTLQKRLVYWLSLYDGVEGAYERPPSRVIENNSLLDRWLEAKSKEAESQYEQNWAKGSSGIRKSAYDHDEVYSMGD
jgi:hypothetical protein